MKKTQGKDAFRNIKKRLVSYLSIGLVIMLGLGGVFITRYMSAGIDAEATSYYDEHGFKTFELLSSLGITEADVAQIKGTEGVTDAEGVIRTNGTLTEGELNCKVEIISMTERISVPEVVEGRAPAAKDECMVSEDFAETKGVKIGDRVRVVMTESAFSGEDSDDEDEVEADEADEADDEEAAQERALLCSEFTVTGLMKHPDYLRRKSTDVVAMPWAAFDKEYLGDTTFSHVFVKTEDPEGVDIFSDKYFKETADTKQALEELAETLEVDSLERTKKMINDRLDAEWQDALAQLEDGQNEIDENEARLNSELADARDDLNAAQRKLNKKIKEAENKIKKARKYLKMADEKLPDAKKYIQDLRDEYSAEIAESLETLRMAQDLLDLISGLGADTEEYKQAIQDLGNLIVENEDAIRKVHEFLGKVREFFSKDEVMEIAEKLKEVTGIDATGTINALKKVDFDVDSLMYLARGVAGFDNIQGFIDDVSAWIDSLRDSLKDLDKWESYIKEFEKNRSKYNKIINQWEKQKNAEKKKYQAQINAGWNMYFAKKAEYEQKLEEAKALLAENREEAEKKFAELKAEVDELTCTWLVLDRRANAGYVDIKSNISAISTASLIFGILFMLISAIVCFSTLTIIIDEQKKMVGTVKAFGFLKGEILGKYLVFGVSAAIIGCIAGILLGLGLSGVVLNAFYNAGMYQFGKAKAIITPGATVLACAIMIAVCALATIIACSDILKSPASILMKGGTAKKTGYRKKTASSRKGSLYSKLVLRNMLDDKVRVIISIIIIAFSTLLIGTGISMKIGYDGMTDKQVGDVFNYDVRVDLGEDVDLSDRDALQKVMDGYGAEYTAAAYENHVFRLGDRLDALNVLAGDPEELGEFFAVRDTKTGEEMALPDDGVLVQKKMKESYGFGEGSTLSLFNSDLSEECEAEVKGVFQNYVGRLVITSPKGYEAIFGEPLDAADYNCFYVKMNGADPDKLKSDMLAVDQDISFEVAREFANKFESASFLYNLIVYVTTGIAILMSFMILSNLANIFLNRKKTELTVMRINGFSIKQTKGYLTRETIVTTAAGVLLGVLAGAIMAPLIIKAMEQPDLQFVRSFHVVAWLIAVGLEVIFAVVIYSVVFRKVKKLNFRDVA